MVCVRPKGGEGPTGQRRCRLVLAGLFATGGTWINKAANSASGGNASISSTAGTITFGGG